MTSSSSSSASSDDLVLFPVNARVVLQGLVKAPELNNQIGIVQSGAITTSGGSASRQQVHVVALDKYVALKPINMKYEVRSLDTLSVKELKLVLKYVNPTMYGPNSTELIGISKSELRTKVSTTIISNNIKDDKKEDKNNDGVGIDSNNDDFLAEELARISAHANAPSSSSNDQEEEEESAKSKKKNKKSSQQNQQPQQTAAEQLSNMSPDQLRQQAQMMKSMTPDSIRRMNPALAHMSDLQIIQAANQMELMANNPSMMKQATDQMKNMSVEELQQLQQAQEAAAAASSSGSGSTTASSSSSSSQLEQQMNAMAQMTPEQMKEQAQMMKTMDPATIRTMNPQLATMTDDQIRQAATQFEMMADNPEMLQMAMNQMKQMNETTRTNNNRSTTTTSGGGQQQQQQDEFEAMMRDGQMDPGKLLSTMTPKQLKLLLSMVKENPQVLTQISTMSGISMEQIQQGVTMFSTMSDTKLSWIITVMKTSHQVQSIYGTMNTKMNGYLKYIVVVLVIVVIYMIVQLLFLLGTMIWKTINSSSSSSSGTKEMGGGASNDKMTTGDEIPIMEEESEF